MLILNLDEGTIRVNLENLHAEGLNDRPANTELTTAELTLITDTVNDLVQELLDRVEAALQGGIFDTEVEVSIGVNTNNGDRAGIRALLEALGTLDISKILQIVGGLVTGLVGGIEIESTLGGLLGTPGHDEPRIESTGTGLVLDLLAPLLDGILSDVVSPLGTEVQNLLFNEVDGVLDSVLAAGPVNQLLNGLSPLLDTVLNDVLLSTLNKQDAETIGGQPGRSVTALDVQLLLAGGSAPLVQLGLATSQVSGPSAADLEKYAPVISLDPIEGPFGKEAEVVINGENLVFVDADGEPHSLVTELTFGTEVVPAADITPRADGSLLVKVPVVDAGTDEASRLVTVTLTTGGGQDTAEYTYKTEAETYDVTYPAIDNAKAGGDPKSSAPAFTDADGAVAVPAGAKFKLADGAPSWASIDENTGVVTVDPEQDVVADDYTVEVVVTYADGSVDEPEVAVKVAAADVDPEPTEAETYAVTYRGVEVKAGESETRDPEFTLAADGSDVDVPAGAKFALADGAPSWASVD